LKNDSDKNNKSDYCNSPSPANQHSVDSAGLLAILPRRCAVHRTVGGGDPPEPALLWTFKTSDAVKAAPVVCNGVIVVGSADGNVYGITLDGK
jgi:hypothetical protein